MKTRTLITGLAALLCLIGSPLLAQKPADIVGTWSGLATLEGLDTANELTLVLELNDGKLAGTMTDQFGTINRFPIGDVVLDKGILSFSVPVENRGGEQMSLKFKMTLSKDAMKGAIEAPEMNMKGAWEATKK